MEGWIAVDLDGTLAEYDGWTGPGDIGKPVPAMLARVKAWLAEGMTVKIFTARVWENPHIPENHVVAREAIEKWCTKHIGFALEVTNVKDYDMIELWDDRARQVLPNTGIVVDAVSLEQTVVR